MASKLLSTEVPDQVELEADDDKGPPAYILRLPEEILIKIGHFLNLKDLIYLSCANKRMYKAFHTHNKTWEKFFKEFCLTRSLFIEKVIAAEVSDSFDEDDEDGDSHSASPVNWSCPEKVSLKLHRQTQLNIERGEFLRRNELYTESRFNVSDCETTIPLVSVDSFNFYHGLELFVWDEETYSKRTFKWSHEDVLEIFENQEFIPKYWHDSQLILRGDLVVIHFKIEDNFFYRTHDKSLALIVAKIEPGAENLTSLWHHVPGAEESKSWWVILIKDKLYRFSKSYSEKGKPAPPDCLEILCLQTGAILKKIVLEKEICNVGQEKPIAHNNDWIAVFCQVGRSDSANISDILIFDVNKSSVKYLDGFKRQKKHYTYPLVIRDNKVYTILYDGSIPVWNAESGSLLSIEDGDDEPDPRTLMFRRLIVTDYKVVAFSSRKIRIYNETEEGLTKIGEKSLTSVENHRRSKHYEMQAAQVIQDTAVISFSGREKKSDYIYLAFFPLKESTDRASAFKRISNVDEMGKCNFHYYVTIPATPTSLHCYVGCDDFLYVYNFFRLLNTGEGSFDYDSSDESYYSDNDQTSYPMEPNDDVDTSAESWEQSDLSPEESESNEEEN